MDPFVFIIKRLLFLWLQKQQYCGFVGKNMGKIGSKPQRLVVSVR